VKHKSKKATHVALVIDRSSSMDEGVILKLERGQLDALNAAPNASEIMLTQVRFSSRVEVLAPMPLKKVPYPKDVEARGMTALLDAIGKAHEALSEYDNRAANVAFLMIIVTDGGENNSQRYSLSAVQDLIRRGQDSGQWTFVYLSTHPHDPQLGIEPGNMHFGSGISMGTVGRDATKGIHDFMEVRKAGRQAVDSLLE